MPPRGSRCNTAGLQPIGRREMAQDDTLVEHMARTYNKLRMGMGLLAVALPVALAVGGLFFGAGLQSSMSAYYHTHLRDVLVGSLWAVGAFLVLYKGFGPKENRAFNIAGVLAVMVALFPTERVNGTCASGCIAFDVPYVHGVSAVLFFLAIAYVCIFRSGDTLPLMNNPAREAKYKRTYQTLGVLMVVAPLAAAILIAGFQLHLDPGKRTVVFFVEAFAIWVFGAYWLVKSREIRDTHADLRPQDVQAVAPQAAGWAPPVQPQPAPAR